MNKILVEVYRIYGDRDVLKLAERYVTDNTDTLREDLIKEHVDEYETLMDMDSFLNGASNSFTTTDFDVDFDEPTGTFVEIITYNDKKERIENEYKESIKELSHLFNPTP